MNGHECEEVISREQLDVGDISRGNCVINNNNYKTYRNDAKDSETQRFPHRDDVETRRDVIVEDCGMNKDEITTAENMSSFSTETCGLSATMTSRKTVPLTFSIDRIMDTHNDGVGRIRKGSTTDDDVTSEVPHRASEEQRTQSRPSWKQRGLPFRCQKFDEDTSSSESAELSWISRQQTTELAQLVSETRLRRQHASFGCSPPSQSVSAFLSHVSPLQLLYRHLQSSVASSWLDAAAAARYASFASDPPRCSATMLSGQLRHTADPDCRFAVQSPYSRTSADERLNATTACDWRNKRRVTATAAPTYAASGALDLSRRSTHNPPSLTNDVTSGLEMTPSSKTVSAESDRALWIPVVDLKGSLENIINQDTERPIKQISCPVCGKMFNAHYNLTRHMPVHTGIRPFICKVGQSRALRQCVIIIISSH